MIVFLVDMNAFYISCEQTRHKELVGRPAAVAGDPQKRSGIILTANYEARKCGVKTAMVIQEAKRLCPQLITVPPDHDFYAEKSSEVMKILSSYTPIVEQNSVDEAWLDMTGCTGRFKSPRDAARDIMARINNELGLWCSIGIAENKFLSKMASDMKKPQGITELWQKDIQDKLWPLPVRAMYGVGKQTAEKLNEIGIMTIKDLATFDKSILVSKFGKRGGELFFLANGIDNSTVTPHSEGDMKSIGRSITLPEDIVHLEDAKSVILKLSDEIATEARKYGKKGRTIQITIKYSDFKSITRQVTTAPTCIGKEIYLAGADLLKENWTNEPVRLLGISISGFEDDCEYQQLSLFALSEEKNTPDRADDLDQAIYSIREKYGYSKIQRGLPR